MSIVVFLVILVILILVHEFGHFITAKKFGIRVDEFGIGFPPRLWGVKKGETIYSINAIPFGGFVRIFGEDPDEESLHGPDSARSFVNQKKWVQMVVITAGVLFNILLGWLLISLGFLTGLPVAVDSAPAGAQVQNVSVTLTGISPDSPAERAGLATGDRIVGLASGSDVLKVATIADAQVFIDAHGGKEVSVQYIRGSEENSVSVMPVEGIVGDRYAIGISMDAVGTVKLPVHRAFWEGGKMTVFLIGAVTEAFAKLIGSAFVGDADIKSLTGPVGIVGIVGSAIDFGFVYVISFMALISINLGVLNLIPFPALDGGRAFFLIVEALKGSPINPKFSRIAHLAGFAALILLMLVITYNDVVKITQ